MARFMLIAGSADLDKRIGNPKFAPVMFERYMAWIQGLRDSGRYVAPTNSTTHSPAGRSVAVR